jgi:hypothetical protein
MPVNYGGVWNWSQWLLNPVAALAKQSSLKYSKEANQQLLVNLGQTFREVALKTLAQQAIALYSSKNLLPSDLLSPSKETPSPSKTQTLREIISQAQLLQTSKPNPLIFY